tara:strand:+ start:2518 stop:3858 length:1341 start_codon:yes stop_codon:yes gene_type:complete
MSKFDLILKNCNLINENKISEVDIGIRNKRIEKISPQISNECEKEIDVKGKNVAPGVIDDQVHFREPGLTQKGEIKTESLAALYGGITSTMDMPNVSPASTTLDLLEERFNLAAEKSWTNYSFYLGATPGNIDEVKKANPRDICGLKIFMGSSTGDLLVNDDNALDLIFKESPILIVTHCEDNKTIEDNLEKITALRKGKLSPSDHALIRDDIACFISSEKAVNLAKKYSADLHVLHLTTEKEIDLFEAKPTKDKKITTEACIHHLVFTSDDYEEWGNFIKCNPSVKAPNNREALRNALKNNQIDIIATDHAPHTRAEKSLPYPEAPAGIPLIQHSFQLMLELANKGIFSIEEVIKFASHNTADRFRIIDRGYVREGYFADLVIFETGIKHKVTNEEQKSKCGWTPFEGWELSSRVNSTIVNGNVLLEEGELHPERRSSERLVFNK